jgi:hypothetical protein
MGRQPGDVEGTVARRGGAGATTLWRHLWSWPRRFCRGRLGRFGAAGIRRVAGCEGLIARFPGQERGRWACVCKLSASLFLTLISRSVGADRSFYSFHSWVGFHVMCSFKYIGQLPERESTWLPQFFVELVFLLNTRLSNRA